MTNGIAGPGPDRVVGTSKDEAVRGERHEARLSSRILVGGLIGALVGVIAGLIAGFAWFGSPGAIFTMALAGLIGLGGLGAFAGGLSGLESPDPTREPLQSEEPLADPPTSVEHAPAVDDQR